MCVFLAALATHQQPLRGQWPAVILNGGALATSGAICETSFSGAKGVRKAWPALDGLPSENGE